MAADPYALADDGSARDPDAFRAALRADPARLEALEKEPEVAAIVLGEDVHAFQELIKSVFQVMARPRAWASLAPRQRAQGLVQGVWDALAGCEQGSSAGGRRRGAPPLWRAWRRPAHPPLPAPPRPPHPPVDPPPPHHHPTHTPGREEAGGAAEQGDGRAHDRCAAGVGCEAGRR